MREHDLYGRLARRELEGTPVCEGLRGRIDARSSGRYGNWIGPLSSNVGAAGFTGWRSWTV